jgi:predicted transcriptional regulator
MPRKKEIIIDWELVDILLDKHYTMKEIAKTLNIFHTTLSNYTKEKYGITFKEYKRQRLIRDGLTAAQRHYRNNKEKCKEAKKKWDKKHPNYPNEYYLKHRRLINDNNNRRRQVYNPLYKGKERRRRLKIKLDVINGYGGKCACCGEIRVDFLTIDHINNDGKEDRKKFGRSANKLYRWLIANNFPEGYQILCMNCNFSKYLNKGKCIHQIEKEQEIETNNT